jgi:hypothetical protein
MPALTPSTPLKSPPKSSKIQNSENFENFVQFPEIKNQAPNAVPTLPSLPVRRPYPCLCFWSGGAWIISHRLWAGWLLSSLMNLTMKKRIYTRQSREPESVWGKIMTPIYNFVSAFLIFICAYLVDLTHLRNPESEPSSIGSDLYPSTYIGANTANVDKKDVRSDPKMGSAGPVVNPGPRGQGQSSQKEATLSEEIQAQIKNLDDFVLDDCTDGFVCFALDYRNFPQGHIFDMITDFTTGVNWVVENVHLYGGDVDKIFVMGQSAGAHILILAALQAYANLKNLHLVHYFVEKAQNGRTLHE